MWFILTLRKKLYSGEPGARLPPGGASPYALYNMLKFDQKYICFYNSFYVRGAIKDMVEKKLRTTAL